MMPRSQFTIKTLLWLMALVAAFFACIAFHRGLMNRQEPEFYHAQPPME
jgi:hypothetical protein